MAKEFGGRAAGRLAALCLALAFCSAGVNGLRFDSCALRADGLKDRRHLGLRGGGDAPPPAPSFSAPPAPGSAAPSGIPPAPGMGWDQPTDSFDAPPPAPVQQRTVPPPAPTFQNAGAPQFSPPKAPAAGIPPAPAPPAGGVSWDETSVSPVRKFIDLFGWENISPFFFFLAGVAIATVKAMWHNTGDDDIDLKSIPSSSGGRPR